MEEFEFGNLDKATYMWWFACLGGLIGMSVGLRAGVCDRDVWPMNVGGLPIFAWWPNLIIIFELTMLGAITATTLTLIITRAAADARTYSLRPGSHRRKDSDRGREPTRRRRRRTRAQPQRAPGRARQDSLEQRRQTRRKTGHERSVVRTNGCAVSNRMLYSSGSLGARTPYLASTAQSWLRGRLAARACQLRGRIRQAQAIRPRASHR